MDAPNPALLHRLQRLVLASTLVNYSFNFIYPLLALLLMDVGHWSAGRAALVLAGAYAASSIGSPWIGRAIDRQRYGVPLAIAFFGNLLGVLALTESTNAYVIFFGATAILFSGGCINTMANYVREGLATNETRRAVATRSYVIANLGFAISGALAFFFLKEHRTLLLSLDVASHLVVWAALWYASRQLRHEAQVRHERVDVASWREILSPAMLEVMGTSLLLFIAMNAQMSVLQFLYRELGLDAGVFAAATLGVNSITVFVVGLVLPYLNLSLRARTLGGAALACVGLSLQPLITSLWVNSLLTILWATGEVLLYAELSQAYFRDLGPRNAGAGSGLRIFTTKVSQVLCPLIAVAYTPRSVPSYIFLFGIPCLVAGYGLCRILERPPRAALQRNPLVRKDLRKSQDTPSACQSRAPEVSFPS